MSFYGANVNLDLLTTKEIENYLHLLNQFNIKIIYSNLNNLSPDNKEKNDKLLFLLATIKKNNQNFFGEINNNFLINFDLINLKPKDIIKKFMELGFYGIKCNNDIDLKLQAKLTYNFKVMLEGANTLLNLEKTIISYNLNPNNTINCYKYYRQRFSATSQEFYLLNQFESHSNNIPFSAFVSTKGNDNAVSLEIHRDWKLKDQINHLIALNTDIIFFYNHLNTDELKMLTEINHDKISLKIKQEQNISSKEKNILFNQEYHIVRSDLSNNVIRSTEIKKYFLKTEIEPNNIVSNLEVGDVIILNKKANKYQGELQIVTKPFINDGLRNLVAKIENPYLQHFIKELKATRQFLFFE